MNSMLYYVSSQTWRRSETVDAVEEETVSAPYIVLS